MIFVCHTPTRPLSYSRPVCMVSFCLDFIDSDICLELGWVAGLFKQNSNSATANATNKPPIRMKKIPATLLSDSSLRVASCFSGCLHSVLSNHHLFNNFVNSPFSSSDRTARLMGSLSWVNWRRRKIVTNRGIGRKTKFLASTVIPAALQLRILLHPDSVPLSSYHTVLVHWCTHFSVIQLTVRTFPSNCVRAWFLPHSFEQTPAALSSCSPTFLCKLGSVISA